MNQYKIVKILLLINFSFFYSILAGTNTWLIEPNLDCGIYEIYGKLKKKENGDYILTLRKGSQSPMELIVLGGSLHEKEINNDLFVKARIYVPIKINDHSSPTIFLQNLSRGDASSQNKIKFIQNEACNDPKLFRNAD